MKKIFAFVLAFMLLPSIAGAAWVDRTDVGGIVTASADNPPNEAAAMAFDNRLDTKWLAFVDSCWIQFDFNPSGNPDAAYAITKYAITSGGDAPERDPKDWTFEGSDDGISWDILDTRSGESWVNRIETREFSAANTTAYKIYRLNISANQTSPGLTQVTEISLYEDDGTLEPWINRTEAGGTISASGDNPPNEAAAMAFDGLVSSKWLVFADSAWIQFQFPGDEGYAISKYAITSANDWPERDPMDWEFQGSYDGVVFFTIDSQTNQSWTYRFETKEYTINNNVAFPIYRLNILANLSPVGLIQAAEITFYEAVRAKATNPTPANLSVDISTDQILSWDTAEDPNNPGGPIENIVSHELYMTGPDSYSDPNLYFVASIPAGSPVEISASYPPAPAGDWLERDGMYAWRIDEVLDNSQVIVGDVWAFATVFSVPIIDSSQIEDLVREEGESASFTVSAVNPFTGDETGLAYQWYQGLPGDTSTPRGAGQTLVIDPVSTTDEGYYYCRVTVIATGGWADSDTGSIAVPRLIGHWPFEGDATDIVGGNNGAINGGPTFVTGIVGTEAVEFNSDDDNITLPTAAHLGKAWTLAWWENADPDDFGGGEGDWESMLASGPTTGYEVFEFNRFNVTRYAHGVTGDYIETSLTNPYQRGLWYHHTVTYDPATGDAIWYLNGVATVTWNTGDFDGFDTVMFVGDVREGSQPFRGIIDDLLFYNYTLDAYEVAGIYTTVSGTEICVEEPSADLTGDCAVNLDDLLELTLEWLACGRHPADTCL